MRRLFTIALSLLALGGAAGAADLPPAPKLPPMEAEPPWTGFYAGLNVGGGFGSSRNAFTVAGFGLPSFDTSLDGVIGGGEAGYNWQTGPWVLGLEANFEGSGLSGGRNAPCLPPLCGALAASYRQGLSWFGTLRPRIGYALANWLLYATGGAALGQVETNATVAVGPFVAADRRGGTQDGWTLGGGVEVALAPGWSAKIEYLRLDLGSRTTTYLLNPPISNASRFSANVIHHRRELPLLIQSAGWRRRTQAIEAARVPPWYQNLHDQRARRPGSVFSEHALRLVRSFARHADVSEYVSGSLT